jgi:large subunit ribosomal protein L19e
MNLKKKKQLAARTLGIGKNRIILDRNRLEEVKEAITRQDIRDLKKQGIIKIKEKRGRKKKKERKTKRREGSKKKRRKKRKQEYVKMIRKMRRILKNLKEKQKISKEEYWDLRNKIKARKFRDSKHLLEAVK